MPEDVEFASAIHKRYNFCEEHRPDRPLGKCPHCEILERGKENAKLWDYIEALQDANAQLKLELESVEQERLLEE